MNPKFKQGEIVIANFKNYPQNNGEYTILEIMTPEQAQAEFNDFKIQSSVYYRLEGLEIVGPTSGTICSCAAEPALRKKHDKGNMSYKELMNSLKSPVLEWK